MFVLAALVAGFAMVAERFGARRIATLGLGISGPRRAWLVVFACGAALVVAQAAPAAAGDAVARRVVLTHHSALKARYASVKACVNSHSASCLQNSALVFYGAAMRAKTEVVALRAGSLSETVRDGVDRDLRALDLQARYGNELYRATRSLDTPRIYQTLAKIRYALANADQAVALIYS